MSFAMSISINFRSQYPVYQKAVEAFLNYQSLVFHRLSKSGQLSQIEKKLLKMRFLKRHQKFEEAMAIGKQINGLGNLFLSSEADFLLASCNFLMGQIAESYRYNLKAYRGYQKIGDQRGSFLTSYNLSVDLNRLGRQKESEQWLSRAEACAELAAEKALILRARACAMSKQGDWKGLREVMVALETHLQDLNAMDQAISKSVLADLAIRLGEFDRALFYLSSLVKLRKIEERPRVFFEYSVLRSFLGYQILKAPHRAVLSSQEYRLKWRALSYLQSGQMEQGFLCLNQLRVLLPDLMNLNFRCKLPSDANEIFFRVLQGLLNLTSVISESKSIETKQSITPRIAPSITKMQRADPLSDRLIKILTKSPSTHVDRVNLIESLWKRPYSPKLDSRFYKLIERTRKGRPDLRIVNQHHAYLLEMSVRD